MTELTNAQVNNKRYFESDLSVETNEENEAVNREVKRHQRRLSESTFSPTNQGCTPEPVATFISAASQLNAAPEMLDRTFVVRNIANGATTSDVESLLSPFSTEPPTVTFISAEEALVEMEVSSLHS